MACQLVERLTLICFGITWQMKVMGNPVNPSLNHWIFLRSDQWDCNKIQFKLSIPLCWWSYKSCHGSQTCSTKFGQVSKETQDTNGASAAFFSSKNARPQRQKVCSSLKKHTSMLIAPGQSQIEYSRTISYR